MKFLQTYRISVFFGFAMVIATIAVVTGCGNLGGPSLLGGTAAATPSPTGTPASGNLDGTSNCSNGDSLTNCGSVWTVFTPTL